MSNLVKYVLGSYFLSVCFTFASCYRTPNNFHSRIPRATKSGCTLPEKPLYGSWSVYDPGNEAWFPGKKLPCGKCIIITCNDGYMLKGSPVMNCINDEWTIDVPKCLKKCPPLQNSPHLTVTCYGEDKRVINCSKAVEGSYAQYKCEKFYEIERVNYRPNYCSKDGTWRNKIPKCVLTCGKNKYDDNTFINGGEASAPYAYPWQVAIYNKRDKNFTCGGSLIDQRIVLTAAHCITKDRVYSKDTFEVAVGKYYSKYYHSDNEASQFSSVQEIFLPCSYQGESDKYKNDIALIITKNNFTISERVRPICIDWDAKYLNRSMKTANHGFIAGWGFTKEDGSLSNELNELKVPAINRTFCTERLPSSFLEYFSEDKFCAGYLNQGKSACKGDSGGGLIFREDGRFYISGIVSAGPSSPHVTKGYSCDNGQYGLYTTIAYHKIFLTEKLAEAQALGTEDGSIATEEYLKSACRLPEPPQFGYYLVNNNTKPNTPPPGQHVKSETNLIIQCQDQYVISGRGIITCRNRKWDREMGICLKTCPSIQGTENMDVTCTYKSNEGISRNVRNCYNAIDGTLAEFKCAPFYEDIALSRNPVHICMNGKWDQPTPVCSPACGKIDDTTNQTFFPWHVAIYNKTNKNLICSGSIINEKVIVTAAYCVIDNALNLKPAETFLVKAGGHYRAFKNVLGEHVQISEVSHVFLPNSRTKFDGNDIAILVVRNCLELNQRILPICLDKRQVFGDNAENVVDINVATTGWGYNIDKDENAKVLKTIKVSLESLQLCREPRNAKNFTYFDKRFCLNDTSLMCYGDAGASLVYQVEGRYYLGGIRSVSSKSPTAVGVCERQQVAVYTNAFTYALNFILQKEAEFRPNYI